MADMKCTMIFHSGIQGFSETWYYSGVDYTAAMTALRKLANARHALCGAEVTLDYLRVSDEAKRRDSLVEAPNAKTVQKVGVGADIGGESTLIVDWGNTDKPDQGILARVEATADFRGMHCIRGVPDALIVWPDGPSNLPGWDKAFEKYKKLLIGTFSLRVRAQNGLFAQKPIVSIDPAGGGSDVIVFTVPGHGFLNGQLVRVTNFRLNRPPFKVNGTFTVSSANLTANTFSLRSYPPFGALTPYVLGKPITPFVQLVGYGYATITDVILRGESSRKPGRPFGQRAGRLLSRR